MVVKKKKRRRVADMVSGIRNSVSTRRRTRQMKVHTQKRPKREAESVNSRGGSAYGWSNDAYIYTNTYNRSNKRTKNPKV